MVPLIGGYILFGVGSGMQTQTELMYLSEAFNPSKALKSQKVVNQTIGLTVGSVTGIFLANKAIDFSLLEINFN
jgi:hypothetical protein